MGISVFIGWDSREVIAYEVARKTILENSSIEIDIFPIKLNEMISQGIYTRGVDPLASTEFTYSRFFVPYLNKYNDWAIFVDCDFLFFGDIGELISYCDPSKAVSCVQHNYKPKDSTKMDGQAQTVYPRKNWSSFMLFNCGHSSTKKLTPELINRESGAYLHRMQWADDSEIGSLPAGWNWLEGWDNIPDKGFPQAVHYTRGGPWFENYQNVQYADIWRRHAAEIQNKTEVVNSTGS